MRIKLDQNVWPGVAQLLEQHAHDVTTVRDEGLSGQKDAPLWSAVLAERRFFITWDRGFSKPDPFPVGPEEGVLVLKCGDMTQGKATTLDLLSRVLSHGPLESLGGCVAVASDHGLGKLTAPAGISVVTPWEA